MTAPIPFRTPPADLCVLRLSALGDVCHVLPVVRTIQDAWPATRITWILGKLEHKLLGHLPGIEFVVFDKGAGLDAYGALRRRFAGRRFDVLLHMQLALRASLVAAVVPARVKVGFDRARARELQWLFTNERIAPRTREHVLDSLFGFAEALGVQGRSMRWDIPLPPAALEYAARAIPDGPPTLVVSPCSSHELRNWNAEGYAAVADYAASRHGMRVLLCGGRSALEARVGEQIVAHMRAPVTNLIGRDTLLELLATLGRATALLTPDSGPAHMATAVGTPVIGLYAATNPARSGPYYSRPWCVDRYAAAAERFEGRAAAELPWTEKIERPGVMDLIEVDAVIERLDALMAAGAPRTPVG
ncbi:MAG TPA: glycosyltransferase family 9 protein [Steroidobacteraceae bacterium]|nr:glycosyltransferase family 9 protein [Steroidobacteraceae bacterium]